MATALYNTFRDVFGPELAAEGNAQVRVGPAQADLAEEGKKIKSTVRIRKCKFDATGAQSTETGGTTVASRRDEGVTPKEGATSRGDGLTLATAQNREQGVVLECQQLLWGVRSGLIVGVRSLARSRSGWPCL